MKRAATGTKRKKAIPARKPTSVRAKASSPKTKKRAVSKAKRSPKTKRKALVAKKKTIKHSIKRPATTKKLSAKPKPVKKPKVAKKLTVKRVLKKPSTGSRRRIKAKTPISKRAQKPRLRVRRNPQTQKSRRKTVGKKNTRQSALPIPAFLLEGDEPSVLTEGGAAEKFALGPTAPPDHFDEGNAPLPATYNTRKLFLTARDPHWLYAHWDFSHEEQFRHNARSVDRHLVLRVFNTSSPGKIVAEIHVHPESKHWFAHVDEAGEKYFTELGYYQTGRKWKSLAVSAPQRTPPDNISPDSTVEFATIPLELSFETMLEMLREDSADDAAQTIPLARAIESIRLLTRDRFPDAMHIADWTPEQEDALAEIISAGRAGLSLPSSQDSARGDATLSDDSLSDEFPSSYASSFFGGESSTGFWLVTSTLPKND